MVFRKLVEIGRVAYATGGPEKEKLCAIVDVIDYNRVLVDGPCTGFQRQAYHLLNLKLTNYKIRFQHGQRSKFVAKAWKDAKIDEKWKESPWVKAIEKRKLRESLNDFDRFKVGKLKRVRSKLVKTSNQLLLKEASKKKRHEKKREARKKLEADKEKLKKVLRKNKVFLKLRRSGFLKKKALAKKRAKLGAGSETKSAGSKLGKKVKKSAKSAKDPKKPIAKDSKKPTTTKGKSDSKSKKPEGAKSSGSKAASK